MKDQSAPEALTLSTVIIKFAGDSGDGMQLTGSLFTENTAQEGNDLATFPDYPAEIRAPRGTVHGVSGFQIHFGSQPVYTPGDLYDVLVAMNAAALKTNLHLVQPGGLILIDPDGFDPKNLRLAQYEDGQDPLSDPELANYEVQSIAFTSLTREALKDTDLSKKQMDLCKNMYVLGYLFWKYNREPEPTIELLERKFGHRPALLAANITVLKTGYHYGETTDTFRTRYKVDRANLPPGEYRNIMGNEALALGLIAAAKKADLQLFYGSYPITPASDLLHYLSRQKALGVKTFQAEDEIAAIGAAIGAAYGGELGVTGTSGPGLALKSEALNLAIMLELPLVVVDVQRGGPSTGMPTKTEQSDLMQAIYGRNGESPIPVIAAHTPADCFAAAYEACRIALRYMTPVLLLSDGYLANGSEPWAFPRVKQLPKIVVKRATARAEGDDPYWPYQRDEEGARTWAIPGTPGLAHRIGGLEKEAVTGAVSYNPANHEYMVKVRQDRINRIADDVPSATLDQGEPGGQVLLIGWGSTYGVCTKVAMDMLAEGYRVGHLHLRYLNPFPNGIDELVAGFDHILVPEINNGQLVLLLRAKYGPRFIRYNKIQGIPITAAELRYAALQLIEGTEKV